MGYIKGYKCNACGHTWERHEGSGFVSFAFHCNKCGKEEMIELGPNDSEEPKSFPCACGGTFKPSSRPICSVCKSKDISKDNVFGLWD